MTYSEFLFHCRQLVDAFTMRIISDQDFDHAIAILMALHPEHAHEAANDWAVDLIFSEVPHLYED